MCQMDKISATKLKSIADHYKSFFRTILGGLSDKLKKLTVGEGASGTFLCGIVTSISSE